MLHDVMNIQTALLRQRAVYISRRGARTSGTMFTQTRPTKDALPPRPAVVIVMGVSGCGKSTVGALLASRLRWEYEDADWLHPVANVDKMHSGVPLTDEDRRPWLEAVAWIDHSRRSDRHGVVTCSAPKRRYRDVLIVNRADVRLVYLKRDEALIARRVTTRHELFMRRSLLHNQFEALEKPGPDESPIAVTIEPRPHEIVTQIVTALNMVEGAQPPELAAPEITRPWRVNEPVRSC
jgi:gluconokinase